MASVAELAPQIDGRALLDTALGDVGAIPKSENSSQDDYRILLPNFEGPLDLLLHLIRKEQINVYDIPIARICKSYVEHLELMQQIDVNVAGEFMVMAATLTFLKSAIILPREGGDEEEDPRLPLVAQLLEYERFKKASQQIDARPWLGREVYGRPLTAGQEIMPMEALANGPVDAVDTFQMLLCLKIALDRTTKKPLNIAVDQVSLKEKVSLARELFEANEIVDFALLLPQVCRAQDVIVSFMAILELAKLKFIEIIQYENFGKIQLRGVRSLKELNEGMLDQY